MAVEGWMAALFYMYVDFKINNQLLDFAGFSYCYFGVRGGGGVGG